MARPIHFQFSVSDPEKAQSFYAAVFGWTFQQIDVGIPYWVVTTGPDSEPGINGGFMKRPPGMPAGTTNSMQVSSVDAAVDTIKSAGGVIVMDKMAVPGVGWIAYAVDPDGNIFGIREDDPGAA